MEKLYSISSLAKNGRIIIIFTFILIFFAKLVIPSYKVKYSSFQYATISGKAIKYNDTILMKAFFQSIKDRNGVLCLGTSESTSIDGGNYYDFLNNDTSISKRFSILSGAGRTCGIYDWMLIEHPDWFKDLNIIYMVNPAYWRTDLCEINLEYWNRYNNYYVCKNALEKHESVSLQTYSQKLNSFQKASFIGEYFIRKSILPLNQNLKYLLNPDAINKNFSTMSNEKSPLSSFKHFGLPDYENLDTVNNIEKGFSHIDWLKPINESSLYRYQELQSFISLAQNTGAKIRFVICPFNKTLLKNYNEAQISEHEKWRKKLIDMFNSNNQQCVDATDISELNTTFVDHQHFNSYAAFLIYLKLKPFYESK
jgi:hypothetical protein